MIILVHTHTQKSSAQLSYSKLTIVIARNIDKLEWIQQRATKLVPELAHLRIPYKARLQHLNLYSLYCQRQRGDLIEVHKLINHLNRVSPDPFFILANSVTRGHDYRIFKQHCRITSRLIFLQIELLISGTPSLNM